MQRNGTEIDMREMTDEHLMVWRVVAVVLSAAAVPCALLNVEMGTLVGAALACAMLAALVASSVDVAEGPGNRSTRGRRAVIAAAVAGVGAVATVGFIEALGLAGFGVALALVISQPTVLRRLVPAFS